jgi:hypothetical protein
MYVQDCKNFFKVFWICVFPWTLLPEYSNMFEIQELKTSGAEILCSYPLLGTYFIFLAFLSSLPLNFPNFQRHIFQSRIKLLRNFLLAISGLIFPWHKTNTLNELTLAMVQSIIDQCQDFLAHGYFMSICLLYDSSAQVICRPQWLQQVCLLCFPLLACIMYFAFYWLTFQLRKKSCHYNYSIMFLDTHCLLIFKTIFLGL